MTLLLKMKCCFPFCFNRLEGNKLQTAGIVACGGTKAALCEILHERPLISTLLFSWCTIRGIGCTKIRGKGPTNQMDGRVREVECAYIYTGVHPHTCNRSSITLQCVWAHPQPSHNFHDELWYHEHPCFIFKWWYRLRKVWYFRVIHTPTHFPCINTRGCWLGLTMKKKYNKFPFLSFGGGGYIPLSAQ